MLENNLLVGSKMRISCATSNEVGAGSFSHCASKHPPKNQNSVVRGQFVEAGVVVRLQEGSGC